jgi:hypothetical protein
MGWQQYFVRNVSPHKYEYLPCITILMRKCHIIIIIIIGVGVGGSGGGGGSSSSSSSSSSRSISCSHVFKLLLPIYKRKNNSGART